MCQATVYLDNEKILEEVIWLEPTEDGVLLRTFFGEPQEVNYPAASCGASWEE